MRLHTSAPYQAPRVGARALRRVVERVDQLPAGTQYVVAIALLAGICALEAANNLQDLLALASSY